MLQPFPQFHPGFSNALTVTVVYDVTIKKLLTQKCSNTNSVSYMVFLHHVEIYRDASKNRFRTAAAVVAPNSVKTVRLPENASIFTAEIHALDMSLDIIRRTRSRDYVVFSDSLSSLQAIDSCNVENPLILKILKDRNQLSNGGKSITFCWIPSHVGIRGNEDADIAAKAGLDVAITNIRFPVSDLFNCVNQLCVKEWQQLLNQCTSNKLYSVQSAVGRSVSSSLGRYDSVLINRLRIGHTRLTNSYLLKGESQPVCEACHSPLTVEHFLVDCIRYSTARQRYFGVTTIKDVFENVASRNIIAYVKDIGFCSRI